MVVFVEARVVHFLFPAIVHRIFNRSATLRMKQLKKSTLLFFLCSSALHVERSVTLRMKQLKTSGLEL